MVIRVDRRALYFVLGIILLGIPLAIGLYLGGFMSPPAAPNQAAGTPASPAAVPPAAVSDASGAPAADQAAGDAALAAVPRISVDDAKKKLGDPNTVFIDARTPDQFAQGHLNGALSVPETDAVAKSADLPKDKDLILYCT